MDPRTNRPFTTTEELRVDILARQLVGNEREGGLEALLAVNPGLAGVGHFVPEGTRLAVPPRRDGPQVVKSVNPWE